MAGNEQTIEEMILRSLDGRLSEEEQLELDREVIRNPEARRLMDSYRKLDELAAGALQAAVPQREASLDPEGWIAGVDQKAPRWRHRNWWLAPGAVAAAVLALVINYATLPQVGPRGYVDGNDVARPKVVMPGGSVGAFGPEGPVRRVSNGPQERIKRDTARDYYGIQGEDGRIYWIEVDRTRTIKKPTAESLYRAVSRNEL